MDAVEDWLMDVGEQQQRRRQCERGICLGGSKQVIFFIHVAAAATRCPSHRPHYDA